MMKLNGWFLGLALCSVSVSGLAQNLLEAPKSDLFETPYEVREQFRNAACETIVLNKAGTTDLGRQEIYVATCSGIETYLMAVMCINKSCQVMR